jgi:DNA-directed RNA polymerase specialized sigma24 family protein
MDRAEVERLLELWGSTYRGGWPRLYYPSQSIEQFAQSNNRGTVVDVAPLAAWVEQVICALDKDVQQILVITYVLQLSQRAAAAKIKISLGTYHRRLDAARDAFASATQTLDFGTESTIISVC